MHHVAKLMEVGLYLVVLQQGGRIGCGLGEVGHHGSNGDLAAPILPQAAWLQAKAGRMPILAFPGWGRGTWGQSWPLRVGGVSAQPSPAWLMGPPCTHRG